MTIGDKIFLARREKKLSRNKFLKLLRNNGLKMGVSTLQNIENGSKRDLKVSELRLFCEILDKDTEYFLPRK